MGIAGPLVTMKIHEKRGGDGLPQPGAVYGGGAQELLSKPGAIATDSRPCSMSYELSLRLFT